MTNHVIVQAGSYERMVYDAMSATVEMDSAELSKATNLTSVQCSSALSQLRAKGVIHYEPGQTTARIKYTKRPLHMPLDPPQPPPRFKEQYKTKNKPVKLKPNGEAVAASEREALRSLAHEMKSYLCDNIDALIEIIEKPLSEYSTEELSAEVTRRLQKGK